MKSVSESGLYLRKRGGVYWYRRRVPAAYRDLDTRGRIEQSLRTKSYDTARLRRDLKAAEDEKYWAALAAARDAEGGGDKAMLAAARRRYEAAQAKALAAGYAYIPADQMARESPLENIIERLFALVLESKNAETLNPRAAEALMGGAGEPPVRVSDALEIFINEIAIDDLMYKSEHQRYSWKKVRRTSVDYFIDKMGDLPMREITRAHALEYQQWWAKKMSPKDGSAGVSANTVNRHIGNMRSLYVRYFKHIGEDERPNPFRNMFYKHKPKTDVPPFSADWIRKKILRPRSLKGIRADLQLITFLLIETGCRPSEIINLRPEDIRLNEKVPYIAIRARNTGKTKREVKTETSERDIPLVGVSLHAARRARNAFPHYYDRNELFSANMMKTFRRRGLLQTPQHRIYSFRHSFEKRMQEANIDYGLRCLLMGHKTTRPVYGDGGDLAYRRDELLKIALPFSDELFKAFDEEHAQDQSVHASNPEAAQADPGGFPPHD